MKPSIRVSDSQFNWAEMERNFIVIQRPQLKASSKTRLVTAVVQTSSKTQNPNTESFNMARGF